MNKNFVTLEQAKRLKELGFRNPVNYHYTFSHVDNDYVLTKSEVCTCANSEDCNIIDAPTLEEARQWFFENSYYMWLEPWLDIRQYKHLWSYYCKNMSIMSVPFSSLNKYEDYNECFRNGINHLLDELENELDI